MGAWTARSLACCLVVALVCPSQSAKQPAQPFLPRAPLSTAEHVTRPVRTMLGVGGCKKLLWFTAIGGSGGPYKKYIRVAMTSAREKAPSLVPHLIYSGEKDEHFLKWYKHSGGTVHHHNLSFYDKLQATVKAGKQPASWLTQHGAYLRMDIPLIMKDMALKDPNIETEYILYTDADVMFWRDINTCSFNKPEILSIGPEWTKGLKVNSGVMYINVAALGRDREQLIQWGEARGFPGLFDQTIITGFYGARLALLPDKYNWKAYWGWAPDIVLVHLHGPKPEKCLDCLVVSTAERKDLSHCKCPGIYMWLWTVAPDKGRFYADVLLKYYKYLLRSHAL